MEESKIKNNKKKMIILVVSIILIIVSILVFKSLITIKSKQENKYVTTGTTVFEGVGHYSVAIAGNNNADRGTSIDRGYNLIQSYPENWNEIKKNIPSNILSRVNNMSGSRLDFNGSVQNAWLTTNVFGLSDATKGDILIIKPNGSYEVIYQKTTQTIPVNITESGWYYISLLSAPVQSQQAWALTAVYENHDLPIKYVNVKQLSDFINGSTSNNSVTLYFNNKFSLKDEFELFGVALGGGWASWPKLGETEDIFEAILDDGTYKQLYENTYNGKNIFVGRTNSDFFNGIFNTIRSHNIKGGELDIFYERLGKDYFNNRDVVGYKATKIGKNVITVQLMGIAQEISYSDMEIKTDILNNRVDKIVENDYLHIITNIENKLEGSIGYNTKFICKLDEALSEVINIVVKIDGIETDIQGAYNRDTNEIIIDEIDKILLGQTVTVEYDVKVNSNIQNKGELNSNVELPIEVNVQSYPIDINALEESEQEKYRELYVEEESTINVSGIYKKASEGVEVKYIDEVTREEIELAENKTGYYGEKYQTEEKEIAGYELVEVPTNKEGTMTEEKITIVYKYRKISKVIVRYVDINNGEEIERVENTYKEGESYTTDEKEIEGYRLISVPEEKVGIVEREDIVVEYRYKKIVIGVEVKYIDEVTGEEIEIKESISGIEGDNYETEAKEISGYELVEEPINASGEMREDLVTVTYKYRKLSKVVVRHVDKNSGKEFDRIEKTYKEGDNYETNEKEISGYKLVEAPENTNGVVGREDIEVVYEYRKIAEGIEVKYIDEVTNEEIETSEHEVGLVGEEYLVKAKKISGYELVEEPENEKGIIGEEKIIITYKYRKISKVIIMYIEKDSGKEIEREEREYKEGDSYKVEKKEISGYKLIESPKNTSGIVERKDIMIKYYYEREKVLIKVEIDIVDENGNIIETIEKEGYIGDTEEIELPEIDGYYTEEKNIKIEYGKENNIKVTFKKKIFDLPNTSDINIYVYIGIFVVSIIIISLLIKNSIKKKK